MQIKVPVFQILMNATVIMEDAITSVETFPEVIPVPVELDISSILTPAAVMVLRSEQKN